MKLLSTNRIGLVAGLAAMIGSAGASNAQVVISQVFGGGGSSAAQAYKQDAIELYNLGSAAVSLSGFSLQYASAAGNFTSVFSLPAGASIGANGYYLIRTGTAGTGAGVDLSSFADANGTLNLSATAGKVILVNNATAVGTPPTGLTGATIVDGVGYGSTASAFEGLGPAPAPANNLSSIVRVPGVAGLYLDTNNNNTDFVSVTPVVLHNSSGGTISSAGGAATPGPSALLPFAMGVPMLASKLRRRRK